MTSCMKKFGYVTNLSLPREQSNCKITKKNLRQEHLFPWNKVAFRWKPNVQVKTIRGRRTHQWSESTPVSPALIATDNTQKGNLNIFLTYLPNSMGHHSTSFYLGKMRLYDILKEPDLSVTSLDDSKFHSKSGVNHVSSFAFLGTHVMTTRQSFHHSPLRW